MHFINRFTLVALLFTVVTVCLNGQNSSFSFIYEGPDVLYVDENCMATLEWGHPETPQAFSNLPGGEIISFEINSISGGYEIGDPVPPGELITILYEATDNFGNSALYGFGLPVFDSIPPEFDPSTLPDDLEVKCIYDIPPPETVEGFDNCMSPDFLFTITYSESETPGVCEGGVVTRTWVADDDLDNQSTYTQTITVLPDTFPPFFTNLPVDGSGPCEDAMDSYSAWLEEQRINLLAGDEGCGLMEVTDNAPPASIFVMFCGDIPVLFVATDSCGNTVDHTATFSITNSVAPTLVNPAGNGVGDCSAGNPQGDFQNWLDIRGGAEAVDDCSGIIWSTIPENPSLADTCGAEIEVTFLADDGCGNTVSTTASYFVTDTVAPIVNAEAQNLVVNCIIDDPQEALGNWLNNIGNADISDLCTPDEFFSISYLLEGLTLDSLGVSMALQDSFSTGCRDGILINGIFFNNVLALMDIEFQVADACGNVSSTSGLFAVTDAIGPTITTEAQDQIISCDTVASLEEGFMDWYNNAGGAEGEDDCGSVFFRGEPDFDTALDQLMAALDTACTSGATVQVDFYINDFCGNENEMPTTATFGLLDTISPVLTQNATDLSFLCDTFVQVALQLWLDDHAGAQAEDDCASLVWTFAFENANGETITGISGSGPYPELQDLNCDMAIPFTFVATDFCGNNVSSVADFIFLDTLPPVFGMIEDTISVPCDMTIEPGDIDVTDDCSAGSLSITFADSILVSSDTTGCGAYQSTLLRVWTATDECGNESTASQVIITADDEAPVITLPGDISVNCISLDSLMVPDSLVSVVDNCDPNPILTFSDSISGGGCNFVLERIWMAIDACGNQTTATQTITVTDSIAPTVIDEPVSLVIPCDTLANIEEIYQQWIDGYATGSFEDNCSQVGIFMALPGSYNQADTSTFPGTPIGPLVIGSCDSSSLVFVEADIVFYDDCANVGTRRVSFSVIDQTPPDLSACPEDISVFAGEDCQAEVSLTPPVAIEACLAASNSQSFNQSQVVSSSNPGDQETPVEDMTFNFSGIPVPPAFLTSAQLEIKLLGLDAEQETEYFNVMGENDVLIGITDTASAQCDTTTTLFQLDNGQINQWIDDGEISITLATNIPEGLAGRFSINDICPGATVEVTLSYVESEPGQLDYTYQIDGGEEISLDTFMPIDAQFGSGIHSVIWTVADCSGNVSSCTTQITLTDTIPPEMECPDDMVIALEAGEECTQAIELPLPTSVSENCGLEGQYESTLPVTDDEALITFAFDPDLNDYLAEDKSWTFNGVGPVAQDGSVFLEIEMQADADSLGEYFTITIEGNQIGTTEIGNPGVNAAGCDGMTKALFNLNASEFNAWASDGIVEINATSNTDFQIPPAGTGDGINPCNVEMVTEDGDTDGMSYIKANLRYEFPSIKYYVEGATEIDATDFPEQSESVTVDLNVGLSTVHYILRDLSGNVDSCSFDVQVNDEEAPKAICTNPTIFLNPSGVVDYVLTFEELDGGSEDNCGIDSAFISPSTFTCDMAGTEASVQMIVFDASGLSDTCETEVRIEVAPIEPTFIVGICENDTLVLMANAPDAPGNPYTYEWEGPNEFSSTLENPIIPNIDASFSGSYIVTVTGFNGCSSSGSVNVIVDNLNAPDLTSESQTICEDGSVILTSTNYNQDVTYMWYRGIAPNGILLGSSVNPSFIDIPPGIGTFQYYVIVESDACTSNPSANVVVEVVEIPLAEVQDAFLQVCEGEVINIGSLTMGNNYTYSWSGPDGFMSDQQIPPAILDASEEDEGLYTLIISIGDCVSDPVFTEVIVDPVPPQPMITGDTIFCENGNLILTVNNVEDADRYVWFHPDGSSIPTPGNTLSISDISEAVEGAWMVIAELGDCTSDTSAIFDVNVESSFIISATNNGPACAGDSVTLSAPDIPNVSYQWIGPEEFNSDLVNPTLPAIAGTYFLTVMTSSGCVAEASTLVEVNEAPNITAVSNNAGNCANGTTDAEFFVTTFPPDPGNYSYQWIGPNNFTSTDSALIIEDITEANNGNYAVIVFLGNCPSDTVLSSINVTNAPEQPVIEGVSEICVGDDLVLSVNAVTGDSVTYQWETPLGFFEEDNNELQIQGVSTSATGTFTIVITADGCPSQVSEDFDLNVIPLPEQPMILAPSFVCEGDTIFLLTDDVPGATYSWTGPSEFVSNLRNPFIFPATDLANGNYFVEVTVGPCQSPASEPHFIEVRTRPDAPIVEQVTDIVCLDDPSTLVVCIDPNSAVPGGSYTWSNAGDGTILGNTSLTCFELNDFSSFSEGINGLNVFVEVEGCASLTSTPVDVEMVNYPDIEADAGIDMIYCPDDEVILGATPPGAGIGQWSSLNPDINFTNPQDPETMVSGLTAGINTFIWSLDFESCIAYDSDTITIEIENTPAINIDTVIVPFGQTVDFNAFINDFVEEGDQVEISTNPGKGNALYKGDGIFTYSPNIGFVGTDEMMYRVCSMECPEECDEATVILIVGDESNCFVPTIFTPNEDGVNDQLIIPCLETDKFPDNHIVIFNQWGDQVFEANPYLNNWDGTYDGEDLPVATYFYIVDFADGSEPRKGFLILER